MSLEQTETQNLTAASDVSRISSSQKGQRSASKTKSSASSHSNSSRARSGSVTSSVLEGENDEGDEDDERDGFVIALGIEENEITKVITASKARNIADPSEFLNELLLHFVYCLAGETVVQEGKMKSKDYCISLASVS
jgi:hypothetical protein